MQERVSNAFRDVQEAILNETQRSFISRLEICLQQDGGHFEELLR